MKRTRICLAWAAAAIAAGGLSPAASGQFEVPVYVDDSATAGEAVSRALELAAVGNISEAIDVLQRLLDEQGERVLAVPGDPDLFASVRTRVEGLLASDPALLARYEELEGPRARRMLELDELEPLVSTRLMTRAGFEGALRLAQLRIENAQFGQALVELRSLGGHPLRTGDSARAALELLDAVCAYAGAADRASSGVTLREATLLRARWVEAMGDDPGAPPERAETPALSVGQSPLDEADARDIGSLLPRALASVRIGPGAEEVKGSRIDPSTELRVMPVVAGDSVYLCDGGAAVALDRFTLTARWRVTLPIRNPVPGQPTGAFAYSLRPVDLLMPAVSGESVIVIGGDAPDGNRLSERVISCLDSASGRPEWSVFLTDAGDEALAESMIRGPVLIDQGVVVCSAMRINQQKRVAGAYLFGLSLRDGRVLWTRNIGSVGTESAPYFVRESSLPTPAGGLVYTVDPVGVLAAVESATGRVRWVRRLDRSLARARPGWSAAWRASAPLVHDGRVYVASSNARTIRVFDAWTGEQLEVVDARPLGSPDYLLLAGEWLVGVSSAEVKAKPIDRLVEPVPVKDIARAADRGIRGRVVVSGRRVLVPVASGVIVANLEDEDPLTSAQTIELEHMGQMIAMASALVVADNDYAHTYLVWDKASELLRDRMERDPENATAAVTYAELSYRAGQADQIIPAVDRALKAISGAPELAANEAARSRLFDALLEMIDAGDDAPTAVDTGMRQAMLARLDRCAASGPERVAYLMVSGQMHEAQGQHVRAVETYQRVLSTDLLAEAEYRRGQTGVPAAAEATRRIRRIVFEQGPEVYAVFDAEADRELARLNWSLSPDPFEELARRYPVSKAAARAWVEAGDRYATGGRSHMAIFALEEGLRVARMVLPSGDPLIGEAVGRLVHRLEASRRIRDALAVLDDVSARNPGLIITDHGREMDLGAWRGELSEELARLERRPDIGSLDGNGVLIAGRGILRAEQDPGAGAPTDRLMLYDGSTGELSMWRSDEEGRLSMLWDGVFGETLVRYTERGVLMIRPAPGRARDRVLLVRDSETGAAIWESEAVRSLFPERETVDQIIEGRRGGGAFGTPVEISVMVGELMVLVDADTIVVVERSGRAAGFDAGTGTHLWSASLRVGRVHDASLGGGVLAVGGLTPPEGVTVEQWPGIGSDARHGLVMVDARTGKLLMARDEDTALRWARATEAGGVVYGTDRGVSMIDPYRASLVWRNEEPGARLSLDAQVVDDRCLVLGAGGEVRQISMRDGMMRPLPLDTKDRMDASRGDAVIAGMNGKTVIASELGLVVFDAQGELLGVDQRATDWRVLPVALAEGKVCTLAQMGQVLAMERSLYEFNVTEIDTVRSVENRRVELPSPPRDLAVIDDAVAIGTADGVVVIPAPAGDG